MPYTPTKKKSLLLAYSENIFQTFTSSYITHVHAPDHQERMAHTPLSVEAMTGGAIVAAGRRDGEDPAPAGPAMTGTGNMQRQTTRRPTL